MAWTYYQKILAVVMVVTGSINTLATKWADTEESVGRDGTKRSFNHPFLQAASMFLGELMCLVAFKIAYWYYKRKELQKDISQLPTSVQGNQNFNPFIFLPPALCDMIGTSIMYVGLNLTYASSFQMLRGAVIIFTGLLSVAFLSRTIKVYEWIGIFFVMVGLVVVGLSDVLYPSKDVKFDRNSLITGDLLIVMAQIVTATQMVIEEKFITKHNVPPLQGVGWEGFFGFIILSILLIPMYYIHVGSGLIFFNPDGSLEDAIDGFVQMGNSWKVSLGLIGTILSISFFNFAGLSVTKEISATTRMVLDSVRTFVVWIVSIALNWQNFNYLQIIGFLILLIGMCLYNDVIIRPLILKYIYKANEDDKKSLLRVNAEVPAEALPSTRTVESPEIKPRTGSINA